MQACGESTLNPKQDWGGYPYDRSIGKNRFLGLIRLGSYSGDPKRRINSARASVAEEGGPIRSK